jgi:hypothetical protein
MKYEFTDETRTEGSATLTRIRRISDGALGGWLQSESNLSQEGSCWVTEDAIVMENAVVSGDAQITGDARVYGEAQVYGDAVLGSGTWTYGRAQVYGTQQEIDSRLPQQEV